MDFKKTTAKIEMPLEDWNMILIYASMREDSEKNYSLYLRKYDLLIDFLKTLDDEHGLIANKISEVQKVF